MAQTSNNAAGMCEGEQRIALATVIAFQLGKDLEPQQIAQLITFINVINAQLALLASAKQSALSAARGTERAIDAALDEDAVAAEDIDFSSIT